MGPVHLHNKTDDVPATTCPQYNAEWCEDQREPDGTIVRWVAEAVSQRGENGHDAAEAIELCNHICEMERSVRGTASVRVNAGVE